MSSLAKQTPTFNVFFLNNFPTNTTMLYSWKIYVENTSCVSTYKPFYVNIIQDVIQDEYVKNTNIM